MKRADRHLISIYLDFDHYANGAAHPNSHVVALNFVLQPASEIQLRDLFADRGWLKTVVALCSAELHRKVHDRELIDLDQKIEEAFGSGRVQFNLTRENLLLTFSPGVVWWRDPDHVAIPLSNLSDILPSGCVSAQASEEHFRQSAAQGANRPGA